jgi:hypothetical protein
LTHDHSPVGEREDSGEMGEAEAMRHPRRNEVFRDVGSEEHAPDDAGFIELIEAAFPADAALVLCSDGLSDLVPSARIADLVQQHAGRPGKSVAALVEAANAAGGKDNVTAIVVEGDQFAGASVDVPKPAHASRSPFFSRWAFLIYGIMAALLFTAGVKPHWMWAPDGTGFGFGVVRAPQTWRVGPADSIRTALGKAKFGDTVVVEPGNYQEEVVLVDGVSLVSERPRAAIIEARGVGVLAKDLHSGRLTGFRIAADGVGLQIINTDLEVSDIEITRAKTAAIEIRGGSTANLIGNYIHDNPGPGVLIGDDARPRLVHNLLFSNGKPRKRPGLVISGQAAPVLVSNTFWNNGAEGIWTSVPVDAAALIRENYFDSKLQIRTIPK